MGPAVMEVLEFDGIDLESTIAGTKIDPGLLIRCALAIGEELGLELPGELDLPGRPHGAPLIGDSLNTSLR